MQEVTLRIVCGEKEIFVSDRRGIGSLLGLAERGIALCGCTAYDKIVGKAAALLYAYIGAATVHAGS